MTNSIETCRRWRVFPRFSRNKIEDCRTRGELLEWYRLGLDGISTIATEEDIERRRRYQIGRCLELSRTNGMTFEWREFGKNHADEIKRQSLAP